jgi:hypothetical protein
MLDSTNFWRFVMLRSRLSVAVCVVAAFLGGVLVGSLPKRAPAARVIDTRGKGMTLQLFAACCKPAAPGDTEGAVIAKRHLMNDPYVASIRAKYRAKDAVERFTHESVAALQDWLVFRTGISLEESQCATTGDLLYAMESSR